MSRRWLGKMDRVLRMRLEVGSLLRYLIIKGSLQIRVPGKTVSF